MKSEMGSGIEPEPKVKRGKGEKGVLDLSKALTTSNKGDK